jgi:hypothetical protein
MPSGRRSGPIGSLWYQPAPLFLHGHLVGWPLDIDRMYRDLKRWEGVVGHMYLDTHQPPLVTIGAGNMLPNVSAAQSLPFVNTRTGRPATKDEIAYAFQKVTAMPGAPPASHYRLSPSIEITEEKLEELALKRLRTEFIPKIKKLFRAFDDFPMPAREAIIDIAYNAAVGRRRVTKLEGTTRRRGSTDFTRSRSPSRLVTGWPPHDRATDRHRAQSAIDGHGTCSSMPPTSRHSGAPPSSTGIFSGGS